jgi:hypothetical protein
MRFEAPTASGCGEVFLRCQLCQYGVTGPDDGDRDSIRNAGCHIGTADESVVKCLSVAYCIWDY